MGAEFLNGFLFGSDVGAFNEEMLYECVKKSSFSEKVFEKADKELKLSFQKKDYNIGANGMMDMVGFVVDMVNEKDEDNKSKCPALRDVTAHYDKLRKVLAEMSDKKTGLSAEKESISFNQKDITKDMMMVYNAWTQSDFKKFGYFLGETLVKYSKDKQGKALFLL